MSRAWHSRAMTPDGERWNHNIHYYPLILDAIPPGAQAALDVGCGEGMLCRQLRERVPRVVGIDADPASIAMATSAGGDIEYVRGDFLSRDFVPESLDLIASVAALHHMDVAQALTRMRELLRPGGVLAIVGLARHTAADLPYGAMGFFAHRVLKRRHGLWKQPSPIADPVLTHRQTRRLVAEVLPGARYTQHVLFRFSVRWTRPRG